MKAAAFFTVLLAASALPVIPDGSVATAVIRGVSSASFKERPHGLSSKKRRHDASAFDQIIVETLDQPAPSSSHTSAGLILFLLLTGLLIGAVLLLLCMMCLLKLARAQIAYQPVKQHDAHDRLYAIERREGSLVPPVVQPLIQPIIRRPHPVETATQTRYVTHDRGSGHVTSDTSKQRSSKKRRAKESSWYRQDQRPDDDEEVDHTGRRTLSQMRLDLRIKQDTQGKSKFSMKTFADPPLDSSDSSECGELQPVHSTKVRPLTFCLSPDLQKTREHRRESVGKRLYDESRAAKQWKGKHRKKTGSASSQGSQSSELDENFFGEERASEAYQDIRNKRRVTLRTNDEGAVEENGDTHGVTLEQLRTLLDEMMSKNTSGRSSRQ